MGMQLREQWYWGKSASIRQQANREFVPSLNAPSKMVERYISDPFRADEVPHSRMQRDPLPSPIVSKFTKAMKYAFLKFD
jgi:hypothetical protein